MVQNLKQKTVSGLVWRGLETMGSTGAQFVVSIVLARLLLPEQFGLIAMLTVFIQIAQMFVDSGFPVALIQQERVDRTDECTVFYFNVLASFAIYALLYILSPWVSRFFGQPELTLLLRVLALKVVINSLGQIQRTILTRQLNFKRQVPAGWASVLTSGAVGVAMAFGGFGVWALIAQQLTASIVRTAVFWAVSPWRPGWLFSFNALRKMYRYGSRMLASGLLDTVFNNIYTLVIGKMFTPLTLGYYHRGRSLPSFFMNTVNGTVAAVMFPSYASIKDDPARMKGAARRSLKTLYFLTLPVMIGLCVTAESVVRLLLTEKWVPCVPYLQVLCLVYASWPWHAVNLQVIAAVGRSDLFLRLEIIKILIEASMIIITVWFGVFALVLGQLATSLLSVIVNTFYNRQLIHYPLRSQVNDLFPTIIISAFMGLVVWLLGLLPWGNELIRLMCQVACGAAVYLAGCHLAKLQGYDEAVTIIREQISKKSLSVKKHRV